MHANDNTPVKTPDTSGVAVEATATETAQTTSVTNPLGSAVADDVHSLTSQSEEPTGVVDPSPPPMNANSADISEHSKTLVDKVTDKIRGQSMSLPADTPHSTADTVPAESSTHPSHSGSDGDSSDKENSRKRKLSSRSSVATETAARQHLKRPKESDVIEKEEDTEETEAPIPQSPSKPTQVFGFGAFASAKSPFVSAQNSTPSSATSSPKPDVHAASSTASEIPKNSAVAESEVPDSQPPPTPKKTFSGGFAAFAASSPFQTAGTTAQSTSGMNPASPQRESLAGPVRRSKSPVGKHQAFGQYSTGLSRFGTTPLRKSTHDESSSQPNNSGQPEGGSHQDFEDILKATGEETTKPDDAATKLDMHQVQYNTGEEDDLTIFQTRAKLYTQDENFAYKERGTGLLKVNVRRRDGEGARIVMRAEGVLRLLLNMALYPGLICELGPDPKFIKVAEITPSERKLHAIKVGSAKLAQELYDHLTENTPTKSFTPSA